MLIADRIRGLILRGLHAGTMRPGERLPGSRELALEFDVDHRVILSAYRTLAQEGTIELRARGGAYVSGQVGEAVVPRPSAGWISEVLAHGVKREIPIIELHDWLRRSVETLRLRAVVIQRTEDQIAGLRRELRDYYGIESGGINGERLAEISTPSAELRSADLLVTTPAYEAVSRSLADRLGKKLIVVDVRPDLISEEWRVLLRKPVYVVMKDERFLGVLQEFFAETPGAENLKSVVLGRDSLESIPEEASVYITSGAHELLGDQIVPGRIIPPARVLSQASSLELVRFIVEANFRALKVLHREA